MSVFTPQEIDYLTSHTLGRLATVGRDGQPHVVPVSYRFNPDEDAIDIGGVDFGATKKWRDAHHSSRVTLLVDDASQTEAHAIEIRGESELHDSGGETINPRFPSFKPEYIRIRPRRIVSWWVNEPGPEPHGRNVDGRE